MEPPAIVFKLIVPKLQVSKKILNYEELLTKRIEFWLIF